MWVLTGWGLAHAVGVIVLILLTFLVKSDAKSLTASIGKGLLEVLGERKCELVMLENGNEWMRESGIVARMLQGRPREIGGRGVEVRAS